MDGRIGYSDIPSHLRKALSAAYPLPTTVVEANAEYDYWRQRDHDLGLVLGDTSDTQLDLCAYGRQEIILGLLETGLRAQTLADVIARLRHVSASETTMGMPEMVDAALADVESLAAMAKAAPLQPVQSGQARTTATDRRAELSRLLSNVDTARLSDREIARMVGVSPQTVGNMRRKREAPMAS